MAFGQGTDDRGLDLPSPTRGSSAPKYNLTPNWQDPINPPQPQDPYYGEWYAANPQYVAAMGLPPPASGYPQLANGQPGTVGGPGGTQYQPPAPAPPPGGGTGGGPPSTGSLYGPFGPFTGSYQPLQGTPTSWTGIPAPPQWKDIPTFSAPTMEQVQQDPGYQFGLQQGEQALTQQKAQEGLLSGGGTLKDILAWGQNYATQRYNDVYNRQLQTYNTNTQDQYILPYQNALAAWQTLVPADQRQNEFLTNSAYQQWLQQYNMYNNNRNYALDVASRLG